MKINAANQVKVNDIFSDSWGYDQTNIDFYQVVSVNQKSIEVRPIKGHYIEDGFMSGKKTPILDAFKGDAVRKVPYVYSEDVIANHGAGFRGVFLPSKYGSCSKWNGKPEYVSYYA